MSYGAGVRSVFEVWSPASIHSDPGSEELGTGGELRGV